MSDYKEHTHGSRLVAAFVAMRDYNEHTHPSYALVVWRRAPGEAVQFTWWPERDRYALCDHLAAGEAHIEAICCGHAWFGALPLAFVMPDLRPPMTDAASHGL